MSRTIWLLISLSVHDYAPPARLSAPLERPAPYETAAVISLHSCITCRAAAVSICILRHSGGELQDRLYIIDLRVRCLVCVLPGELCGPAQIMTLLNEHCRLKVCFVQEAKTEHEHSNRLHNGCKGVRPADFACPAFSLHNEWCGGHDPAHLIDCLTAQRSRAVAHATSAASWHSRLTCMNKCTVQHSGHIALVQRIYDCLCRCRGCWACRLDKPGASKDPTAGVMMPGATVVILRQVNGSMP